VRRELLGRMRRAADRELRAAALARAPTAVLRPRWTAIGPRVAPGRSGRSRRSGCRQPRERADLPRRRAPCRSPACWRAAAPPAPRATAARACSTGSRPSADRRRPARAAREA
jgi:hypothetical protein